MNIKKIIFFLSIIFILSTSSFVYSANNFIDSDKDGLSDYDEMYIYHTDPYYWDSDGDGYHDKTELDNGYSPRHANQRKLKDVDSDGDGLSDKWELAIGTDLLNPDSDGDGYDDKKEVIHNYDPLIGNATKASKLIKVDIKNQELAYYFNGKLLEKFPISGGVASMPTPKGNFMILDKVPSKNYGGTGYNFHYPNTKWNLHFTTTKYRYYIHGAYWHDNFGHPMSHGCVNVSYENMEQLYEWADLETKLQIF